MRAIVLTAVLASLVLALAGRWACAQQDQPQVGPAPQQVETTFTPQPSGIRVEPWVQGLQVPWSLVFLPDRSALVSERNGAIRLISPEGQLRDEPWARVQVHPGGEGGLMGLALHPDFPEQPYVYAMFTYREPGGGPRNKVIRLRHESDRGVEDRTIIENIPGHSVHNGGRIAFGPQDRMLYITTGDIWEAPRAQDRDFLGGKILRLTPDGEIPEDNPFSGSPVWSLGHRNPQGLAWHPDTGDLFVSEHGPSGEYRLGGMDVVRVVEKGDNVGWPRAWGKVDDDYPNPLVMWGRQSVPPGGIAFWEGDLFVTTMRSEALARIAIDHEAGDEGAPAVDAYSVTAVDHWFAENINSGRFGRLRDAVVGPDGALYVLTSNRDGRGNPRDGDDQILRLTRE